MSQLIVTIDGTQRLIPFEPGRSLRDILDETDIWIRAGCRGLGACGLCQVRVDGGDAGAPTINERLNLDNDCLASGIRLACQVSPQQDLQITVLTTAPKSTWRVLPGVSSRRFDQLLPDGATDTGMVSTKSYGVAVDLGTTHIRLSLNCLTTLRRLAGRYGLNPQAVSGADVMTRLMAAAETTDTAERMSQQVVEAIGEALWDMALRDGIDLRYVTRLVLVGNTAMLSLLSGRNVHLLLDPRYWTEPIDCRVINSEPWKATWGIHPQTQIDIIQPLAGFIGSDLLVDILATRLTEQSPGALLVDFGTNSEIALWDGQHLWITSAAGGPAFEGSGISCGLPAEPGAIWQVEAKNDTFGFSVIAGGKPRGLCGSGLVDLIAYLIKSNRLSRLGRFATSIPKNGFTVAVGDPSITLTKNDIDVFQRAKAAIGTGIQYLLRRANISVCDVTSIHVCGAFGGSLNIINAQSIGLLPQVVPEMIELHDHSALTGCEAFLMSPVSSDRLRDARDRIKPVNLSQILDFDDIFLENLYLQPLSAD